MSCVLCVFQMKERSRFDVQNMTKDKKRSTAFPSDTGEVSVSKAASKHLSKFRVSDQWSGLPTWWPHQGTRLRWPLSDLKGLLTSPAGYGDTLEMGGLDFPPVAPLNSLSDDESSNHREQIFSGSQKFDTWKQDWQIHPLTELAHTRMGRDTQLPPACRRVNLIFYCAQAPCRGTVGRVFQQNALQRVGISLLWVVPIVSFVRFPRRPFQGLWAKGKGKGEGQGRMESIAWANARHTHFSEELFVIHCGASPTYNTEEHIYIFQLHCWLKRYRKWWFVNSQGRKMFSKKDLPITSAEQLKVMQIPCLRSDCHPYIPLLPRLPSLEGTIK